MGDRKTVASKKKDAWIETFKTIVLLLSLSSFFAFFHFVSENIYFIDSFIFIVESSLH